MTRLGESVIVTVTGSGTLAHELTVDSTSSCNICVERGIARNRAR